MPETVDAGRLGLDSPVFDNKLVSPSIWNAEGRDQSSLKIWTVKTDTRFERRLYTCASTICSSASRRTRTCTEPAWLSNTCLQCTTEQTTVIEKQQTVKYIAWKISGKTCTTSCFVVKQIFQNLVIVCNNTFTLVCSSQQQLSTAKISSTSRLVFLESTLQLLRLRFSYQGFMMTNKWKLSTKSICHGNIYSESWDENKHIQFTNKIRNTLCCHVWQNACSTTMCQVPNIYASIKWTSNT